MSEVSESAFPAVTSGPSTPIGGLAERMRAKAELIASQRSAKFPVPGYQSILGVELRALSLETTGRIADKHKRVMPEAIQTLYISADIILMATESFFEIKDDGTTRALPEETTWQGLAQQVKGINPELGARPALIALLTDVNVALLVQLWDNWMGSEKVEIDKVVVEDFG